MTHDEGSTTAASSTDQSAQAEPEGRLKHANLRFFRVIAESIGIQGPTGGVVITAAILAGISGGGTALDQVIALIAMGFVAYAFVIFTRGFNSAGSVYGFTGAVAGSRFGFLSAFALLLVYTDFAGGVYASTADEAQPAFAAIGLHMPWQVYAIIAFILVTGIAYLSIKVSAAAILVVEGVSIILVVIACIIITAKGGYHNHALSLKPFEFSGLKTSAIGLGVVYAFSVFSGFEGAATLGEEAHQPRRNIPKAIAISLIAVGVYEILVAFVIQNAFPSIGKLAVSPVPLVSITDLYVAKWFGDAINFGAVLSSFGAALACVIGASRMLYALARDGFGPRALTRTSEKTGAPTVALAAIAAISLAMLLGFIWEPLANTAVAYILTYGADLIVAAYILAVVAAVIFVARRRVAMYRIGILALGLCVLGYVVDATFVPFPAGVYGWDAGVALATLAAGLLLPVVIPRLGRGIQSSRTLHAGFEALLGSGMDDEGDGGDALGGEAQISAGKA